MGRSEVESPRKERERDREIKKQRSRSKSPVRDHRSSSRTKRDVSESPSPRSKRLKRAQKNADRDRHVDKDSDRRSNRDQRDRDRPVDKDSDRRSNRDQGDRDRPVDKDSDRRSNRDQRDRDRPVDKDSDRRPSGDQRDRDRHMDKDSDRRSSRDGRERDRGSRRGSSPPLSNREGRDELRSPRDDEKLNGDNVSLAQMKAAEEALEAKEAKDKQMPSFELSGKLAAETNRFRGVELLFNEPPDARVPNIKWRLYVFKSGEPLNEPLYVHRQSCYLIGRERRVADIPTDHPSCSKQHAVLQYRQVEQENPDGTTSKLVRPYLMDLGSTNGTFINFDRIEPQRYYELFEKDNIKFGNSSREYVLLHENSAA